MKIPHLLKSLPVLLLSLLGSASLLFAEDSAETKLGQKLQAALEQYNEDSGTREFDMVKFWKGKKMITDSLARALKSAQGFEADPFLDAQDKVPGIVIKSVKIEEALAKIRVGIKPYSANEKMVFMTYVLFLEGENWKIDNIEYATSNLKKILLPTSNALGL